MKLNLLKLTLIFLFTSCTINIVQTDTHGAANDVVDTDPSADADISPDFSFPIS